MRLTAAVTALESRAGMSTRRDVAETQASMESD